MKLIKGQRYRATVHLGLFERIAPNDTIAGKFTEVGFVGVTVSGSGSTRYADGVWGRETMDGVELPSQVVGVALVGG